MKKETDREGGVKVRIHTAFQADPDSAAPSPHTGGCTRNRGPTSHRGGCLVAQIPDLFYGVVPPYEERISIYSELKMAFKLNGTAFITGAASGK